VKGPRGRGLVSVVLVACGRPLMTDALTRLIGAQEDDGVYPAIGPVDADDAVRACRRHHPDVVLLDVDGDVPSRTLDLISRIKGAAPRTKVLALLGGPEDGELFILDFIEAGADGFVDRSDRVDDVLGSITAAAEGVLVLPDNQVVNVLHRAARERDSMRRALELAKSLTQRETEILRLMARALTNDAIAAELHVSVRTVATHVQNVYRKMGVHSRIEALAVATAAGLASLEEAQSSLLEIGAEASSSASL
jgi:DNA-binding NarL/FixJ family response regulator